LLSAIVLAVIVLAPVGCTDRDDVPSAVPALPAASVGVHTAEMQRYTVTEEAVGTVRATLQARIEARVAGRIDRMLAAPGQTVQAGERLARLDVQEIGAKLDRAIAVRAQAEGDLRRERELLARGAATPAELDAAQARASVARAAVREAETMLGYADIVAPFTGVVTRKLADVGDLAGPGRPLLELEDPTQLRLEADVPETIIGAVTLGATMAVHVPSVAGTLQGTVSEMAPAADPHSRTFRVKLDLPATPGLRAGQFGRVAVPVGDSTSLRVPMEAVVRRGQLEIVFVVAGRYAQMRLVKTGKSFGGDVEILSGLEAGDRVVVEGAPSLTDGQPVEPKHEPAAG
jgi:RND family efflux transporter MFP subunit